MTFVPIYDRAAVGERVCDELAKGRTLRSICREGGMPDPSTVLRWVLADPDGFGERYRRAREIGYHLMADELIDIADDCRSLYVQREGDNDPVPDRAAVAHARLRVDTRRWLLAKALPKIYGDRIDLTTVPRADDSLRKVLREIDGRTRGLRRRNETTDTE